MSPRSSAARAPERTEPARRVPGKAAPRPRPALRIVDPADLRSLRPGRVGTIAGVLLFVAFFALAAFQTVIIKSQGDLDDLNGRIVQEEVRQRDLQLALADLQSPERITTEAQQRLGMLAPGEVTYLQPAVDDDDRATFAEPPSEPAP